MYRNRWKSAPALRGESSQIASYEAEDGASCQRFSFYSFLQVQEMCYRPGRSGSGHMILGLKIPELLGIQSKVLALIKLTHELELIVYQGQFIGKGRTLIMGSDVSRITGSP